MLCDNFEVVFTYFKLIFLISSLSLDISIFKIFFEINSKELI